MDFDVDNSTIVIVGSFLSILLMVNAFFLKDILKTLKTLELNFTELNTEHGFYSKLVDKLDKKLQLFEKKHNEDQASNRERLHSLEGAQMQLLKYLEEKE